MQRYSTTIITPTGDALVGATVTVRLTGTTTAATIYSANSAIPGNVLANPVTTDGYGEVAFYAPDGVYDLYVEYAGLTPRTIPDIEIFDISDMALLVSSPDPELAALAGVVSAADKLPYFTGSGAAAVTTLTSFARSILDDSNASTMLSTLGFSTFAKSLVDDADAAAALTTLGVSDFMQTLLNDADAAAARTTLGVTAGGSSTAGINVTEYGAVGDDATNNATAITNAITAAKAAQRPLFFPKGIYRFGSSLNFDGLLKLVNLGVSVYQVFEILVGGFKMFLILFA